MPLGAIVLDKTFLFMSATRKMKSLGYSHLSDTEAPIIPTNSKAPKIRTVFLARLPSFRHQKRTLIIYKRVIWSEWRLTVIAATVRIALVDILDLSEVDIPAGGFLYPAVGWG